MWLLGGSPRQLFLLVFGCCTLCSYLSPQEERSIGLFNSWHRIAMRVFDGVVAEWERRNPLT